MKNINLTYRHNIPPIGMVTQRGITQMVTCCLFIFALSFSVQLHGQNADCVAPYTVDVSAGTVTVMTDDLDNGGSTDFLYINAIGTTTVDLTCADFPGPVTLTLISSTTADGSGATMQCTVDITIDDTTAPNANCVASYGPVVVGDMVTTADLDDVTPNESFDACSGLASLDIDGDPDYTFTCDDADVGSVTLTLTATDNAGESADCDVTITVTDGVAPVPACADFNYNLSDGPAIDLALVSALSFTDNCTDNVTESVSPNTVACPHDGTFIITYTVTDSDNSSNCTATVTIVDDIDPEITCNTDFSVTLDATGNVSIVDADVIDSSSDNCTGETVALDKYDFSCADIGTNTVTATVTDAAGLTDVCTTVVTVEDNDGPTACVAQDLTVELDAAGMASITAAQVNGASADNCVVNLISVIPSAFTCANVGANTVTLTINDGYNPDVTCTSTVTVEDNEAPDAQCKDATVTLTGNPPMATITTADIDNGSDDACGISGMSLDKLTFDCDDISPVEVTLTVTDANGQNSECTANVTITQSTAGPTAVCQNITIDLNTQTTIMSADVDGGSFGDCGLAYNNLTPDTFDCDDFNGTNPVVVTLVVTDNSGNTDVCTAEVTVTNPVTPVAKCKDHVVTLDGSGNGSLTTADVDNGSEVQYNGITAGIFCGTLSLSADITTFDCTNVGTPVTVTLTATESNGPNSHICTSEVTVLDNTDPVVDCKDITVDLVAGAASITPAMVSDNSSDECNTLTLSLDATNFTCADLANSPLTVTLSGSDASGNTNDCTSNVTLRDATAPTALCQDVTVFLDTNGEYDLNNNTDGNAMQLDNGSTDTDTNPTDNCTAASDLTFSVDPSESMFNCGNLGSNPHTVTLIVSDESGNTATCNSMVTVVDNEVPTVTCVDVTVILDATGSYTIDEGDVTSGFGDNCEIDAFTFNGSQTLTFDCTNITSSPISVTVGAEDESGNLASTCTSMVTVEDDMAPTVVCKDITVAIGNTITPLSLLDNSTGPGYTDNCNGDNSPSQSGFSATYTPASISYGCSDEGIYPSVTAYFDDASGNPTSCTQMITVVDDISPNANCFGFVQIPLDANGDLNITWQDVGTYNDNCTTGLQVSLSETTFDCNDVGFIDVTFTVTDGTNSSSCVTTVNVQDNIEPTIDNSTCPTLDPVNPTHTVTLDASGNGILLSSDFGITVNDNCESELQWIANGSFNAFNNPCDNNFGLNDNLLSSQASALAVDCDDVGTYLMTVIPVDENGNNTFLGDGQFINGCFVYNNRCAVIVKIEETTVPVAQCQDIDVDLDPSGNVSISGIQVDNGSTDNCDNPPTSIVTPSTLDCTNLGPNTVILTVSDQSGNSATCSAVVTVSDVTAPVASCNDVLVELDSDGMGSITAADFDAFGLSSDACNSLSYTIDIAGPYDCTDTNGDVTTGAQVVGEEIEYKLSEATYNILSGTATSYDPNSGTPISLGFSVDIYENSYTDLIVDDLSVIRFGTNSSGLFDPSPDQIENGNFSQDDGFAIAWNEDWDDFQVPTVGYFTSGTAPNQIFVLNYSAFDPNSGNRTLDAQLQIHEATGEVQVHYTVLDFGTGSDDITAGIFTNDRGTAEFNDEFLNNPGVIKQNQASSYTPVTLYDISSGDIVTLTVMDGSGNSSDATCEIAILDRSAPTVVCSDMTVQLTDHDDDMLTPAQYVLAADAVEGGSMDNCGVVSATSPMTTFTCSDLGDNNVVLTVTDESGNVATDNCTVTVLGTAPVAECKDITVDLDMNGMASITESQVDDSSSDECDLLPGGLSFDTDITDFDCMNYPSASVILTVTDADGFSSTCVSNVTVRDLIAPMPVCATNIEVQLDAMTGTYTLLASDLDDPTATVEICGYVASIPTTVLDCHSGPTVNVDLTVTDPSGNDNTVSCVVNILDPDPVANCITTPIDLTLDAITGMASITVADIDNGSSDICSGTTGLTYALDVMDFDCNSGSSQTVTLTVDDATAGGSASTCTATVNITDAPAVAECDDITVTLIDNAATITAADIDGGSGQVCGGIVTLSIPATSPMSFDCTDEGMTYPVTLEVTYGGNTTSCVSNVTIIKDPTDVCSCIPENRVESDNPVLDGYYPANQTVISAGTINASTDVHFRGGVSVTLLPGFTVQQGAIFLGDIGPCDSN